MYSTLGQALDAVLRRLEVGLRDLGAEYRTLKTQVDNLALTLVGLHQQLPANIEPAADLGPDPDGHGEPVPADPADPDTGFGPEAGPQPPASGDQ